MTIKQAIASANKRLSKIPSALFDAEIILSYVINKPREYLYIYPEKKLTKKQIIKFKSLISKRANRIPIAYLIHHKEFFNSDFYVNKNVLIPRPETETLVEEALKEIKRLSNRQIGQLTIIDIGTGSGCIAISLAKKLPKVKIIAIDISKKALQVARKNAKKNGVVKKINFLCGNLLEPILKNNKEIIIQPPKSNIVITANLPYISIKQYNKSQLEIKKYEPKKSLVAGKDGLKYYCQLFKQLNKYKSIRNLSKLIFLEIDPGQTQKIKKIIIDYFPKVKIKIKKDLSNRNRLVKLSFK